MCVAAGLIVAASAGVYVSLTVPAQAGIVEVPVPSAKPTVSGAPPAPAASRKAAPLAVPAGATEVDRPSSFGYVRSPTSCDAQTLLTDSLKQLALDVDEQIRQGTEMSAADENALGKQMLEEVEGALGGRLVRSGTTPNYFAAVAAPMLRRVQRAGIEYHFSVLEDTEDVNAFAMPGGQIVVTRPMLSEIKNEAQLATVLGHEIGHIDLRHPVAVFESTRALGIPDDEVISQAVAAIIRLPYSTTQEEKADEYGAAALHEAGYSVFQSVAFWSKQGATAPASPPADEGPFGALLDLAVREADNVLRTHPDDARRACLLKNTSFKLYRDQPRDVAYVGTTNFRKQTAMSVRVY